MNSLRHVPAPNDLPWQNHGRARRVRTRRMFLARTRGSALRRCSPSHDTISERQTMIHELFTPAEVAVRCQVSTKTVLRAIRAGRLRASRLGERGAYRINPEDLDAWVEGTVVRPALQARLASPLKPRLPATPADPGGRLEVPRAPAAR